MRKAIFPGTFDPLTLGHIDLITRASKICDELVVAIANSPTKHTMFSLEERIELCKESLKDLNNIEIVGYSNLTIDFLKEQHIDLMVRGLRNNIDYTYEEQLFHAYRSQLPHLEVIFLNTKLEYSYISSTIVREIAIHHGDVSQYVTPAIQKALIEKAHSYKA